MNFFSSLKNRTRDGSTLTPTINSPRDHRPAPQQSDSVDSPPPYPSRYHPDQIAESRVQMEAAMPGCRGLYGLIISTIDGNELVSVLGQELPSNRIGTMNSSLLALSETIAKESGQRLCRFVILENSDGRVVCLRINRTLVLTCIATTSNSLGMVLNAGRKLAESLGELFAETDQQAAAVGNEPDGA